jgi:predicted enzyme related to lactoylglutathione lyase
MTLTLHGLTFDCTAPAPLARFWADALGYRLAEVDDRHAEIVDPTGRHLPLHFQRVAEGKVVKNRVHPDLHCGDLEGTLAHLLEQGARVIQSFDEPTGRRRIMADPEGNEFCVEGPPLARR